MLKMLHKELWQNESRLTKITIVVVLAIIIASELGLLAIHIITKDWH